jgi:hypothetical protein
LVVAVEILRPIRLQIHLRILHLIPAVKAVKAVKAMTAVMEVMEARDNNHLQDNSKWNQMNILVKPYLCSLMVHHLHSTHGKQRYWDVQDIVSNSLQWDNFQNNKYYF